MKEGWKVVKLGEVCEFLSGYTPKKEDLSSSGKYPYFKVAEMNLPGNEFYLTETLSYLNTPKKVFPKGSIVFPKNGGAIYTEKKRILKQDSVIDLNSEAIIANERFVDIKYLYLILSKLRISSFDKGGGLPSLDINKMMNCPIPLPPLPEQHRIVKKLDAAFEKIDAMKAKAEKNIENARALFQQTLAEELEPKEGWVEKKLEEVCDKVCNIKWQITTDSFKYIDLTSVDRETDNVECCQMINAFNAPSRAKQKVQNGDILFATTRPTLRRLCIINEDYNGAICSTGFCVLRPCSAIHSKWIFYSLKADIFYSYVEPLQKGASYPAITDGDVKCFVVNVPPLPEQQQIVTKLDILSDKCKKLEEAERKTIAECDALKQAILRQAFNGEL